MTLHDLFKEHVLFLVGKYPGLSVSKLTNRSDHSYAAILNALNELEKEKKVILKRVMNRKTYYTGFKSGDKN